MVYTRASRVAVLELSGRTVQNAVAYVMGALDEDYRREWPQVAYDHAHRIMAECRMELEATGFGYNGYIHPLKANEIG